MHLHIITLLTLLLSGLVLSIPGYSVFEQPDDRLDLRDAKTVQVLLFEKENPGVLRVNAKDSPFIIEAEDRTIELKPGDGFIFLFFRDNQIHLQWGDLSITTTALTLVNPDGLLQLFSPETGTRYYRGHMDIQYNKQLSNPHIVNSVGLEQYVASVIGSEMNFTEPEALKSQAVVSRTYTLWNIHKSPWSRFHLKDHEQNQVYLGELPDRPDYAGAAAATAGEILTWSDKLILAAYSSTCGGTTVNNEEMWEGAPLPYLRAAKDQEMCSVSPHYEWDYSLTVTELFEFIKSRYNFALHRFEAERHPSGRVLEITFFDRSDQNLQFGGNEFRLLINRFFEPKSIKSTLFNIYERNNTIYFSGNGLGHGVGMCQWGAKGFAKAGWKYPDILSFYFSGVKIVDLNEIEDQKIALSN